MTFCAQSLKYSALGVLVLWAGGCAKSGHPDQSRTFQGKNASNHAYYEPYGQNAPPIQYGGQGQAYAQNQNYAGAQYYPPQPVNNAQYYDPYAQIGRVEPNNFLINNQAPVVPRHSVDVAAQNPYQQGGYAAPGVSLYQSANLALGGSRLIAAGRSQIAEANEEYIQARAGGLPTIDLRGSYGVTANKADPRIAGLANIESERQVGAIRAEISQPLYDGGKIKSEKQIARTGITLAEMELRATESGVLRDTMLSHINILRDRRVADLHEASLRLLHDQLRSARLLLQYGEGTRADTALIEARLKSVEVSRDEALLNLDNSLSEYVYLTGAQPANLSEPRIPGLPSSILEAQQIAQSLNSDILQALYERDIASEKLKIAKSEKKPKLSLRGSLSEITGESDLISNSSSAAVSLNLSMPFSLGGEYKSKIKQASFALSRKDIESHQVVRDVNQQVRLLWQRIATARRSQSLRTQQVAASQTAYDTLKTQFESGIATQTDLISAERDLLDVKIDQERARFEVAELEVRLLALIGALDRQSLGLGGPGQGNLASLSGARRPMAHQAPDFRRGRLRYR